jgi:glutamyl-tRNA synthetase
MMEKEVRVRFAPSPTGPLHIGGVRTALYNYLFARRFDGNFILRIEDTDQFRFVSGAEDYIKESLSWLNILPDEGIDDIGPHKPYRQSERKEIYQKYAKQLLENKLAYYAFDTPEELENMRNRLKSEGISMPQYNCHSRNSMVNSLTVSSDEVKRKIEAGEKYVIRLKVPENKPIGLRDLIRGEISVSSDTIDDKILIKSDGLPTYHLANVVDDHLMGITHVIRGEEWLPSAPLHILLYQFLGWKESIPEFAHLPLLLKPEGTGKLSKRDGDKHGFPVFPIDWNDPVSGDKSIGFREYGYLPDAMVNFLAFLGWNPGTEQELFSMEDLVREFSIERVNKAGAKFDIEKAKWYNQQYIKLLPDADLGAYLFNELSEKGIKANPEYVTRVAIAFKERITFLHEIFGISSYFFLRPETYDEKVIRKKWTSTNVEFLRNYAAELNKEYEKFDGDIAKSIMQPILDKMGIGMGSVMQVLRVAITGVTSGIDLIYTITLLGPGEVSKRIEIAIKKLANYVK